MSWCPRGPSRSVTSMVVMSAERHQFEMLGAPRGDLPLVGPPERPRRAGHRREQHARQNPPPLPKRARPQPTTQPKLPPTNIELLQPWLHPARDCWSHVHCGIMFCHCYGAINQAVQQSRRPCKRNRRAHRIADRGRVCWRHDFVQLEPRPVLQPVGDGCCPR